MCYASKMITPENLDSPLLGDGSVKPKGTVVSHGRKTPDNFLVPAGANGRSPPRSFYKAKTELPGVDSPSAWMVCAAVCLINITTDGFCFTLGVIFPVLLTTYGESAAMTSWIGSILTGMMLLTGPLIGYLLMKFGARLVCFVGAILAGTGTAISMFARSVVFLLFSLGVLTGFGFGCMSMAGLVSMTTWFDKKRPLALGIGTCVGGTGMFLYPNLFHFLRERYTLDGCFLILGGCMLHGTIMALLLRPAPSRRRTTAVQQSSSPSSFDLSIFRLWHYDLFLLSNFLFALGYFPLLMYVASRAEKELAISVTEANFLPMIIAIANIVGRITVTLLLASERTSKTGVLALAETVGGIVIIVSVFAQSYVTTVVFCVVYGVVGGIIMVAFPVVLADLVPIQMIEVAGGFFVFTVGLAALAGGPISGFILDISFGTFTWVFVIEGLLALLGSSFLVILFFVHRSPTRTAHTT
ncbi:hypothetical protein RvY_13469 [Ramazzottius varieornatus]|uniref:Major facilitator superfamily (MFS) profile domain-containing protein n=1 Tax=Ramazzottius varieornatus TaxID=947166 RepID=A0A1D1VVG2_RAMVA|nr:hypothetical protein RvY_13469 [Ramazzottius varieornatus]